MTSTHKRWQNIAILRKTANIIAVCLPWSWLCKFGQIAVRGRMVALCLHQVYAPDASSGELGLPTVIHPAKLDALLAELYSWLETGMVRELFLTFDDGARGACRYIQQHASRLAKAHWIFFLCPQKALIAGQDSLYASRREALELLALSNVVLGNHTNEHFDLGRLPREDWECELTNSAESFAAAFGATQHFAYPYGVLGVNVAPAQCRFLKGRVKYQWSCAPRTFDAREFAAGGPLPRFAIDGTISVKGMIFIIGLRAILGRLWQNRRFFKALGEYA